MVTPPILIGTENTWSGKKFGREIKLGFNNRSHAEAIRLRDVRIGRIRPCHLDFLIDKMNQKSSLIQILKSVQRVPTADNVKLVGSCIAGVSFFVRSGI